MKIPSKKKLLEMFHNIESFKKMGVKQLTTWAGIFIFSLVFNNDLFVLVHNILTSDNLAEKIAAGLSGAILILIKGKDKNDK